ncbi:MAG: alpha-amylase family protein [Bryobacterales bacterium]|nr:alpha-amylase family protein [Bryobacterales bacterium]
MRLTRRHLLALSAAAPMGLAQPSAKPRPRREESFLGMHFDLHPSPRDPALGKDLRKEQVLRFLDAVKPDYVQYDCKGHAGWLGYPSQVGPSAPNIAQDSLAIWREATLERGVALYIHFSGVWDNQAVARHPDWAAITREGAIDPQKTSTFGPYVDQLMLPQLKEAVAKYGLDGAWVDGECWAVRPDWGEIPRKRFAAESGFAEVPEYPTDPGWNEWLSFQRSQFRSYIRHYVGEMHKAFPKAQIASNWLYSTMVPEKPELPVDFLSGDYLGNAPIAGARMEARYLARNAKSWDLMAWGFQSSSDNPTGHVHKPAIQLEQEAGVVLAQGGGFQIYYQPSREGHLDDRFIGVMAKVGQFCRARQPYCWKTETVPQVAVLYSGHSLYRHSNKLFGGWGNFDLCAKGWLDALIESHFSVDILPDWQLADEGGRYPLIVVPEWREIGDEAEAQLRALADGGTSLLVAGAENLRRFASLLGIELLGEPLEAPETFVAGTEIIAPARTRWQPIEPKAGASILDYRFPRRDTSKDGAVAATLRRHGNAKLVSLAGGLGEIFGQNHAPALREFLGNLARHAFTPIAELNAPATVELVLRKRNNLLQAHLLNSTGMQVSPRYAAIDEVAPVPHVTLRVKTSRPPKTVLRQPGNQRLPFHWNAGVTELQCGPLAIYDIVELEVE